MEQGIKKESNTINSLGKRIKLFYQTIAANNNNNNDNNDDYKFDLDDMLEIAGVEGYDDSSYIASLLKDIDQKLLNNQFEMASKIINKVLDVVMPFDYQQFFDLYEATEHTADRLSGRVCWVLLGPTGTNISVCIYIYIYM